MQTKLYVRVNQKSEYIQSLSKKNNMTVSCCGFITCAIIQYLSENNQFKGQQSILYINQLMITPYLENTMEKVKKVRRLEVKKFRNKMTEAQQKNYLMDWMANYQLGDYLASISQKMVNRQVYFFRQCAFDHPQAMKSVKWQQSQRISQQQVFKGQRLFFTSFHPYHHMNKSQFLQQIINSDKAQPIIIAVDVLGHFNVMILFQGGVFVLDSLGITKGDYDQYVVEFITNVYKKSYLKL